MKILYITYDGIRDAIGQSQIIPYINGLSSRGSDFTVLSFEKKNNSNCITQVLNRQVNWKSLKYTGQPAVISSCYDVIKGFLLGICILFREKKQIIHARGYVSALVGILLKLFFKAKFIFDMRGMWAEEKVDAGVWRKSGFLYKATKYFEKQFFSNADTVIVLTDNAKNLISQNPHAGHKQIEIIPTCVDTNNFSAVNQDALKDELGLSGKFIILYLGSLGTFYAFNEMVDFFSTILKNNYVANPYFLIITNNPSGDVYQNMQSIPRDNYCIKRLPYTELKNILPVADVSLMFYRRNLSKAGCCPTKFGESLACGLPIIINSGIGDTESIIKKEEIGVVVEEFSQDGYKKAMEQLMLLLSKKNDLRKKCRQASVKYFSLENGINKYWEIYQGLSRA